MPTTALEPLPTKPSFDDWAARNAYWLTAKQPRAFRPVGQRPLEPLVLCGHGVSLSVEASGLLIRNGLTHHPQSRETFRFFRGDPNLPPRIIMLDGSGVLSFEVIRWLAGQKVPLIQIDWRGEVVSVVGGSGSAFRLEKVQWQDETRADSTQRLSFCCDLIAAKLQASIHTLRTCLPDTPARSAALDQAEAAIRRLERREVNRVLDLLLVEARAAVAYFRAWRGLPIRWKALNRHPIPEAWRQIGLRRSFSPRAQASNRDATHPVGAMLNYAYGVLYSQVQAETVAAGFDPARGLMHEPRIDASALVLDFMEPCRPAVDAAILKFVSAHTFSGADFVLRENGVCRLAPQLASQIARLKTSALSQHKL